MFPQVHFFLIFFLVALLLHGFNFFSMAEGLELPKEVMDQVQRMALDHGTTVKQNHPEKAAPLFLTQLALGDTSAIVSLKALIPDRSSVEGMLNYGPEIGDIDKLTVDQKNAKAQRFHGRTPGILDEIIDTSMLARRHERQKPCRARCFQNAEQGFC